MDSLTLVALEVQSIETHRFKQASRSQEYPLSVKSVVLRLREKLQEEQKVSDDLKIDPTKTRSKRDMLLARQQEIIDLYYLTIERIQFGQADGQSLLVDYLLNSTSAVSEVNTFYRVMEKGLVPQKWKLQQRITSGYAKNMIENFHSIKQDPRTETVHSNNLSFKLQSATQTYISTQSLPSVELLKEMLDNLDSYIVLINSLRFMAVICTHSVKKLSSDGLLAFKELVITSAEIIPAAFKYLNNWSDESHKTVLLSMQTFATLKCMLEVRRFFDMSLEERYQKQLEREDEVQLRRRMRTLEPNRRTISVYFDSFSKSCDDTDDMDAATLTREAKWTWNFRKYASMSNQFLVSTFARKIEGGNGIAPGSGSGGADNDEDINEYTDEAIAAHTVLWLHAIRSARLRRFRNKGNIFCALGQPKTFVYETSPGSIDHGSVHKQRFTDNFVPTLERLARQTYIGSSLTTDILLCSNYLASNLQRNQTQNHSQAQAQERRQSAIDDGENNIRKSTSGGRMNSMSDRKNRNNTFQSSTISESAGMDFELDKYRSKRKLPKIFGTIAHELVTASVALGQVAVSKYALHIGPAASAAAWSVGDTRFFSKVDEECAAALKCACFSFGSGLMDLESLSILKAANQLAAVRASTSFILMSGWLECLLAAACCALSREDAVTENDLRKLNKRKTTIQQRRTTLKIGGVSTADTPLSGAGRFGTAGAMSSSSAKRTPTVESAGRLPLINASPINSPSRIIAAAKLASGGNTSATASASKGTRQTIKFEISDDDADLDEDGEELEVSGNNRVDVGIVVRKQRASSVKSSNMGIPFHPAKRADILQILSDSTLNVMLAIFHHRHSLTLVHTGLLVMRMLCRDLFMDRDTLEQRLGERLMALHMPLDDSGGAELSDSDDDEFGEQVDVEEGDADLHDGGGASTVGTSVTETTATTFLEQQSSSILQMPSATDGKSIEEGSGEYWQDLNSASHGSTAASSSLPGRSLHGKVKQDEGVDVDVVTVEGDRKGSWDSRDGDSDGDGFDTQRIVSRSASRGGSDNPSGPGTPQRGRRMGDSNVQQQSGKKVNNKLIPPEVVVRNAKLKILQELFRPGMAGVADVAAAAATAVSSASGGDEAGALAKGSRRQSVAAGRKKSAAADTGDDEAGNTKSNSSSSNVKVTAEFTFADLMSMIGEAHIQFAPVVEQLVLLAHQVSTKSHLAKYALIEAGLVDTLQRFLDNQNSCDVYIIALCELCTELLVI